MVRSLVGAVIAAALGALVGAGSLTLAYRRAPGVALPFDLPLPHVLAGFYSLERSGELTFSWTGRQATVTLTGLDRQVPWRCSVRLRGGRAAGVTQPTVAIDVDGAPARGDGHQHVRRRRRRRAATLRKKRPHADDWQRADFRAGSWRQARAGRAGGSRRVCAGRARRDAASSRAGGRSRRRRASVWPLSHWARRCG